MRMTTRATARGSSQQNNATSNVNTRGGHFSHFETVGANQFGGFGAFGNNNNNLPLENNNGNNPPPSPLLPLGFREDLGGGFNSSPRGNVGGLDPNIVALVNALIGANLRINYIE